MRDRSSNPLISDIMRNPFVWGALVLCFGILAAAVYLPLLAKILRVVDPGPQGWKLIMIMSFIPLLVGQIAKIVALFGSVLKRKFSKGAAVFAADS